MLRSPSQDAGKRGGIPNRLDGGILVLAPLESAQSLGMAGLDDLNLLHFHLDIMEFLVERRETRIHTKTTCSDVKVELTVVRWEMAKFHSWRWQLRPPSKPEKACVGGVDRVELHDILAHAGSS